MDRNNRFFAQNGNTDVFEEVTEEQYEKIRSTGFFDYIANFVLVREGNNDTILTMYDVELYNVTGSVLAELCNLFRKLGLAV